MQLTIKLFASLSDFLPNHAKDNQAAIDIDPKADSLGNLIERLRLPTESVHLVLVNGKYIPAEERVGYYFQEGDVLAIWPPIAGG